MNNAALKAVDLALTKSEVFVHAYFKFKYWQLALGHLSNAFLIIALATALGMAAYNIFKEDRYCCREQIYECKHGRKNDNR